MIPTASFFIKGLQKPKAEANLIYMPVDLWQSHSRFQRHR